MQRGPLPGQPADQPQLVAGAPQDEVAAVVAPVELRVVDEVVEVERARERGGKVLARPLGERIELLDDALQRGRQLGCKLGRMTGLDGRPIAQARDYIG